jgi:glycine oxidase
MTDAIVVGGGVIGLLSAWRLALAGLTVALFDKGQPGAEASGAALGVLSPQAGEHSPEWLALARASLALFPALAEELREASGVDIELHDEGLLYAALTDDEWLELRGEAQAQNAAGVPATVLSADEARRREPALHHAPDLRGALHFTDAKQVDNVRLCSALALACARAGVTLRAGCEVTRLAHDGERAATVWAKGEKHAAAHVVVANGSWAGALTGLPVYPAKGQALALEAPFPVAHSLAAEVYIAPRRDGRLLVGATVEDAGFDKRPTAEGARHLLTHALRFLPALKDAAVLGHWAGLRPRSADDLPMLGPLPGRDGVIVATGHFRNGILLAPITAELVKEWVNGQTPSADVRAFAPGRFMSNIHRNESHELPRKDFV